MIIRPMTADDLKAVVYIEYSLNDFPWPNSLFEDSLRAGHQCCVIATDFGLAGFAIFSSVLDEATLLNIAVCKQFQRQGFAKALLNQGLNQLLEQQVKQCFLEVRASNLSAMALYRQFGFEKVGERRKYYPAADGREDAVVMSLQLSPESRVPSPESRVPLKGE